MNLGKAVKVNLTEYAKSLVRMGLEKEDLKKLFFVLRDHGLNGIQDVYRGPEEGDGKILFTYKSSDGSRGYLRFSEYGTLDDPVEETDLADVPKRMAQFFIAGIFGRDEIVGGESEGASDIEMLSQAWSNPSPEDEAREEAEKSDKEFGRKCNNVLLSGLLAAGGCYLPGSKAACKPDAIDKAVVRVGEMKKEREVKLAEKKRKDAEERRKRYERETQEKTSNEIEKESRIWAKARKLITLSEEQDKGWGGIDPDDLRKILGDAQAGIPNYRPATPAEAGQRRVYAENTLKKMLEDYSGYRTTAERRADLGCGYNEWKGYDAPSCSSGEESYPSSGFDIGCSDINLKMHVKFHGPGCKKIEKKEFSAGGGRWR